MNKVLVYCPLHPGYGVRQQTLKSIFGLLWPGEMTIAFGRSASTIEDYSDIMRKYQQARRMVLGGGFDALLTIEADMIVPELALDRLASLDADVAYGLYCSRRQRHDWLVFTVVKEREASHLDKESCRAFYGCAIDSAGIGFGCTLIRREVLEELDFRMPSGGPATDWFFALDCLEKGYRQISDLGTVCGHMVDDKSIVWPDPTQDKLFRLEVV